MASGLETLSYEFPKSAKEAEGTWLFRVQGVDSVNLKQTAFSPESAAIVVGLPPELGHCVPAPTKEGKNKPEGTGAFTKNTCSALSKKHNGRFNWEGGVQKGKFSSAETKNRDLHHGQQDQGGMPRRRDGDRRIRQPETRRKRVAEILRMRKQPVRKVHEPGSLEGKIVSKTLEGVFGIYKAGTKPQGNKAGLELFPNHKAGPFAEYTCGARSFSIRGAVIFPARANKVTAGIELSAKASKGAQKPEGFVEEPKASWKWPKVRARTNSIGLTYSLRLETEEPLELNTVA